MTVKYKVRPRDQLKSNETIDALTSCSIEQSFVIDESNNGIHFLKTQNYEAAVS